MPTNAADGEPGGAERTDERVFAPAGPVTAMSGFDLDLGTIERDEFDDGDRRVVLGILDGETPGEEWIEEVAHGNVLVLSVDGDLNELASSFAREVRDAGGSLMHFRGFLVVSPPGVDIDAERL